MNAIKKEIAFVVVFLFCVSLASATFIVGNGTSVQTRYNSGDHLQGTLNISFTSATNDQFRSGFSGGISLKNLLMNMSYSNGKDYTCTPASCSDGYTTSDSGRMTQKFLLQNSAAYGFVVHGENALVTALTVTALGDAGATCQQQLNANVAESGPAIYGTMYSNELCGERMHGCFNENTNPALYATLGNSVYCEEINLSVAPAYFVGTTLYGKVGGTIQFWIYKKSDLRSPLASATVQSPPIGEINATLVPDEAHYQKDKFTALICVQDLTKGGSYQIQYKTDGCGYTYDGQFLRTNDFDIFAQPFGYSALPPSILQSRTIVQAANDYLKKIYHNNCSGDGCVVPIVFSGVSQNIILYDPASRYTSGGAEHSDSVIYALSSQPSTFTTKFLSLDIGKMNFVAPNIEGNSTFALTFGDAPVFSQNIIVHKGFDFDVGPTTVLLGVQTTFTVQSNKTIISSDWDFGDGASTSVSGNRAQHIYTNESIFTIKVTAHTSDGDASTKTFIVAVGNVHAAAGALVTQSTTRINELKKDIAIFPTWIQTIVKRKVDVDSLDASFKKIKDNYVLLGGNAGDDAYVDVIKKIAALHIPSSIVLSDNGASLPLELGFQNIDVAPLEEISGNTNSTSDTEQIKQSILAWYGSAYQSTMGYQRIVVRDGASQTNIATVYSIDITKGEYSKDAYMIIPKSTDTLVFKDDYNARSTNSATYIVIREGKPNHVEFLSGGDAPSGIELGAYIAPDLIDLQPTSGENNGVIEIIRSGWKILWAQFFVGLGVIIIFIIALYLVLQGGYKRNYERSLFKNKNDLYNLVYYIYNSRRSGFSDDAIRKKLKETKWGGEQITYAFHVIDGKRTGMWEIPIFKFIENKKMHTEIERRADAPIDPRFVTQRTKNVAMPRASKKIPITVKIIAVLDWISAAGLVLLGVVLFIANKIFSIFGGELFGVIANYAIALGFACILLAGGYLIIGIGIWGAKNWARLVNIIFAFLVAIISIWELINSPSLFLTLVPSLGVEVYIIFYLLLSKNVKAVFGVT